MNNKECSKVLFTEDGIELENYWQKIIEHMEKRYDEFLSFCCEVFGEGYVRLWVTGEIEEDEYCEMQQMIRENGF